MQVGVKACKKKKKTCAQRVRVPTELPLLHSTVAGWEEEEGAILIPDLPFLLLPCLIYRWDLLAQPAANYPDLSQSFAPLLSHFFHCGKERKTCFVVSLRRKKKPLGF